MLVTELVFPLLFFFFKHSVSLHGRSLVFLTEPPSKYTLEERSPEEPMSEDLDLDDPCSLPATERPPHLPPPMVMTPSKRTKPNNYHGDPSTFL